MKLIENNKEKGFILKPFQITLEVESIQEARLLWHVFNRGKLKNVIIDDDDYPLYNYDNDIMNEFNIDDSDQIKRYIESKIGRENILKWN